jgi:hypothetical protein
MLLLCLVVIVVVTLLAASLHDVRFKPGRSYASALSAQTPFLLPRFQIPSNTPLWKLLLVWLVLVINMVLFFVFLPPELRRKIIRQALGLGLGVLALMLALRYRLLELPTIFGAPAASLGQPSADSTSGSQLPPFQPPQLVPWTAYLVSLAVVAGLLIALWFFYSWWRKSRASKRSGLGSIADIARASLNHLGAGRPWGDVVIEAYARMSDVLSVQRGIQRGVATTPREFAERLQRAGLPANAVAGLTRLFESARYGGRMSNEADVREAMSCLETIVQACGASI